MADKSRRHTPPIDPQITRTDTGLLATFPDAVTLNVDLITTAEAGRLVTVTTGKIDGVFIHSTRLDFLNQHAIADFHNMAFSRDGWVPWSAYLIACIPYIKERTTPDHTLDEPLEEDHTSGPWDKVKSVSTWLEELDPEFLGLAKDLVMPSCITVIAAPRGLGKSHCAHAVAVALTTSGVFRGDRVDHQRHFSWRPCAARSGASPRP
jgi:hypothetical protein